MVRRRFVACSVARYVSLEWCRSRAAGRVYASGGQVRRVRRMSEDGETRLDEGPYHKG